MRQVLLYIPLKAIGEALPDLPLYIPVILLLAAIIVGRVFKLGNRYYTAGFILVGILFALVLIKNISANVPYVPIYGYGAMLFLAFVSSVWLGTYLGIREGIQPQQVQDVAIWMLLGGILGARLTHFIQYNHEYGSLWQFFWIWKGGLVIYGGAVGGALGELLAYVFILRKRGVSNWKMMDIIAPAGALGLCLGRVGCLLNGCCFGNVACPDCPGVCYPLSGQPHIEMVRRGYETAAGFTLDAGHRVAAVERDSPAAQAGIRTGDKILMAAGNEDMARYLGFPPAVEDGRRGINVLTLEVEHPDGQREEITFSPWSIPLHPTQVYESISMALLVFLLLAYYPLKLRDGSVLVLFMLGYAVHRFLDEMLRTDTKPVLFDLTLSENVSIVVFLSGIMLGIWLWLRPPRIPATPVATG